MKENKIQEYGLVPVKQSDVAHAHYAEDNEVHDGRSRPSRYDANGFNAGQNTHIHKGIDQSNKSIKQIA